VALLWLSAAWVLLSCVPALAHANLVGASPPPGSKPSAPPERVELRFSEPVDAGFQPLVVRDADGNRVDENDARMDPEDARVVLADLEELREGAYTVKWRVTSIDGHVVEGRYGFAVSDGAGQGPDAARGSDAHGAAGPRSEDGAVHTGREPEARGAHGGHSEHFGRASTGRREPTAGDPAAGDPAAGTAHGVALAATALLAGLAPFAALVWLPASRAVGPGRDAIRPFGIVAWVLFCMLAVAGVCELSAYAMRASGEPLSVVLFRVALLDSRVGAIWLARLGLGLLTAVAITAAARSERVWLWWTATGVGSSLLVTLTLLSHAAAEGRFLPLVTDWLHAAAASLWMGGLLGFALVLSGPMRALTAKQRTELRRQALRRFSNVATSAVMVLAATGSYAALLHVASLSALVGTPYGRALVVKLVLVTLVLTIGGANFMLRGREPFERLVVVELALALGVFVATGFLTSLPPAAP
jgi:copper transport protein